MDRTDSATRKALKPHVLTSPVEELHPTCQALGVANPIPLEIGDISADEPEPERAESKRICIGYEQAELAIFNLVKQAETRPIEKTRANHRLHLAWGSLCEDRSPERVAYVQVQLSVVLVGIHQNFHEILARIAISKCRNRQTPRRWII
jgi:hypothetical protein